MVLKSRGSMLLKEVLKYIVLLMAAGVVGYLAGHWGTADAGQLQSTTPTTQAPSKSGSDPSSLESRLTKLERKVEGLRSDVGSNVVSGSLERRVSKLEDSVGYGGISGFGSLESRVSGLERSLSTLERNTGATGFSGFGSIESRLSSLERSVSSLDRGRGGY
jgi:hypothetical protein